MIAFTADNHIGVRAQWSIRERGDDFVRAFHDMVDRIIEDPAHEKTLLIGGDLFDTAYPPSFAVEAVQSEITRLRRLYGCTTYGIDGNHDCSDGKWLRVCGATPLSEDPVVVASGVRVCGLHYQRASSILEKLNAMADRGVKCDVLVLHLAFGDMNRMGASSDLSSAELLGVLKSLGVRLVLLGHIHMRQSVTIDGITFAYCGSTELCSINEPQDKSFDVVNSDTFELSRIPIKTRKIRSVVIRDEREFAEYSGSLQNGSDELQSVYVVPEIADGVKRLRELASERSALMRVHVIHSESEDREDRQEIDRTAGVIGLEQAIELQFRPDSDEAEIIRSILRSPETLKLTIENYMKKEKNAN